MGARLCRVLVAYYDRHPGQLVFRNPKHADNLPQESPKRSLNQVVEKMRDRLVYAPGWSRVFSDIINGRREFTKPQLDAFADLLNLDAQQYHDLDIANQFDESERRGLRLVRVVTDLWVDDAERRAEDVYRVGIRGDSDEAIRQSDEASARIRAYLPYIGSTSAQVRIVKAWGRLRFEAARAHVHRDHPRSLRRNVEPIARELRQLGGEWNLDGVAALSNIVLGMMHYGLDNHEQAIRLLQPVTYELVGDTYFVEAMRQIAVSVACLGDREAFAHQAGLLETVIEQDQWATEEQVINSYEGMARARAVLKDERAFTEMEKARSWYRRFEQSGERSPYRQTQLNRSDVVARALLGLSGTNEFARIADEGLRLAEQFGFPRPEMQIKAALEGRLHSWGSAEDPPSEGRSHPRAG